MGQFQEHLALGCDLTVISCIDFRLQRDNGLFRELHAVYGADASFDLLTLPGSCYRLVRESDALRDIVLEDLAVSVSLHQPEVVAIVQHDDCGKYQSVMTFKDRAEEDRVLTRDAHRAAQILKDRFTNVEVQAFIARLLGDRVVGMDRIVVSKPAVAMPGTRGQMRV